MNSCFRYLVIEKTTFSAFVNVLMCSVLFCSVAATAGAGFCSHYEPSVDQSVRT